jgi:hypothetical protein
LAKKRRSTIRARDLGIELSSGRERELFRWFLACLLFGKPIRQEIARDAFFELDRAGLSCWIALTTFAMIFQRQPSSWMFPTGSGAATAR